MSDAEGTTRAPSSATPNLIRAVRRVGYEAHLFKLWADDARSGRWEFGPVVLMTRRHIQRSTRRIFELGMQEAELRTGDRPPRSSRSEIRLTIVREGAKA